MIKSKSMGNFDIAKRDTIDLVKWDTSSPCELIFRLSTAAQKDSVIINENSISKFCENHHLTCPNRYYRYFGKYYKKRPDLLEDIKVWKKELNCDQ